MSRPISISVTKDGKKMSDEHRERFDKICTEDIDGQAKTFLKAFMRDFLERVEEILKIASDFKNMLPKSVFEVVEGVEPCYEMDEVTAHKFLEKNGETMTVRELRAAIADIDINKNFKVGLIEFLLFKFGKDVEGLLDGLDNAQSLPHLEEALEKAIEECMKVMAEHKAKEEEMARLQALADKGGVKGMAAKATLAQMLAADQLEENRREIQAAANQRKAKKQLEEGGKDAVDKALEDAKKEKEEAIRKKKEESRAKLAAKAAMFGGAPKDAAPAPAPSSGKKWKKPAAPSEGSNGADAGGSSEAGSGPCGDYRLDMAGASFGDCKCGYGKLECLAVSKK